MDVTTETPLCSYMATLTTVDGFNSVQCQEVILFHRANYFVNCLLTDEEHANGSIHFHSLFDCSTKAAGKVTQKFERFYSAKNIPFCKGVSVCVKSVTDKIGAFIYLLKDQDPTQDPLVVRGWKMTFIQEAIRGHTKKIPFKVLLRDVYKVTKSNGTEIVLQYAKDNKMTIDDKQSFGGVVCAMVREKYRFASGSYKFIYTECMCMCGDDRPLRALLETELFNLP